MSSQLKFNLIDNVELSDDRDCRHVRKILAFVRNNDHYISTLRAYEMENE
jgi:hypothetical protein